MSGKVANVIAVELGILILIGAWLAVARVPGVIPAPPARAEVDSGDTFAALTRSQQPRRKRPAAVDYLANQDATRASQVEEPAATAIVYEQEQPADSYAPNDSVEGYISGDSPYYDNVIPEPVLTSPDCLVSPYGQVTFYPQTTQYVVYSAARSGRHQPRARPRTVGPRMNTPGTQPRAGNRPRSGRVAPRRDTQARNGGGKGSRPKTEPRVFRPNPSRPVNKAPRAHFEP